MPRPLSKNVLKKRQPRGEKTTCLVADSPHSGRKYPRDFGYHCDLSKLRHAEDAYLERVFGFFPAIGVPFLQAEFPRSYIDPNRAEDAPDLVRRKASPRHRDEIYKKPLGAAKVFKRVARYHRPYHAALAAMTDAAYARHGKVVHINCHSMMSSHNGYNRPDIILGTLDGASCDPKILEELRRRLADKGYRVEVNVLFKGREIIRRTGRPDENRHSIQIEVRRGLYMREDCLRYDSLRALKLKRDLKSAFDGFAQWCDAHVGATPVKAPAKTRKLG